MWPRIISLAIFRLGSIMTVALVSFLPNAGRNFLLFDYAQTLAFAPVTLFGQTLAQAALPVLAREKDNPEDFKITFMSTFTQMLYIVLPVSALILVLRIPIVRIVYGASKLDWEATVLIGRTLAWFSFSIFAQALIALVARGFYALHNTKIPLMVNGIATFIMLLLSYAFITYYHFGIQGLAAAYSLVSIIQLLIMLILLDKKIGGFKKIPLTISLLKLFFSALFTTFALYIPIKLLDQLVFDTTKTVNLLMLTGISSFAGLSLYLFLTWLFNVEEAHAFVLIFKKAGNWREILRKSDEPIDATRRTS
jgi:putative peptidoglycan lipid II flippase